MNNSIQGLVEFSRNLGVIETAEDLSLVSIIFFSRAPELSRMDVSTAQLNAYAKHLGMRHIVHSRYPGWSFAENSAIRESYAESYKKLYGKEPEILTIHAGLECGIISEKLPGLDIISCGPVVLDLHSPDEALNVASFERFFTVVKDVIGK
jgi:dipeptidase D